MFFHLKAERAVLSDTNEELINAFQRLKQDSKTIEARLAALQREHTDTLYYKVRTQRPSDPVERAVRFLYLNRTCFNGIYRVNLKGDFNVPIGTKNQVEYAAGYLAEIAKYLRGASIRVADFEKTISDAGPGDFVFADPPYTVMHNNNNFLKYNANLFSWSDQLRLASALKSAASRGASIMLSNADHQSVRELYKNFGKHHRIVRSSILAADAGHRRETTELLVTYEQV